MLNLLLSNQNYKKEAYALIFPYTLGVTDVVEGL